MADMQPQTITDWGNFALLLTHLASYLSWGTITEGHTESWFITYNLSRDQLWWSRAHTERFYFCLNVCSSFEICILHWYPSCRSLRSVVDRETATLGNFTTISKSTGNKDPIRLTFIYCCCLGFGTAVNSLKVSPLDSNLVLSFASFPQ